MSKTLRISLITFIAFGVYFIFDDSCFRIIRNTFNGIIQQAGISHILTYIIIGAPLFIGTYLIVPGKNIFDTLGLNRSLIRALLFSIICTLPMFIGFAFLFPLNPDININTLLIGIIAAGFFEELYFRAFLFGQLFRYTSMGFISSVLLGALLFGLLHLYQSNNPGEIIGIFLVTFLGAVLFSWTYAEWNYNIWVPVFLHMLMNFAWELFNVSENALGAIAPNIFRTITIALIILLTLQYKKRNNTGLEINRNSFLFWKKIA